MKCHGRGLRKVDNAGYQLCAFEAFLVFLVSSAMCKYSPAI